MLRRVCTGCQSTLQGKNNKELDEKWTSINVYLSSHDRIGFEKHRNSVGQLKLLVVQKSRMMDHAQNPLSQCLCRRSHHVMASYIRVIAALPSNNSTRVHCYGSYSNMFAIWPNIRMNWTLLWLQFYRNYPSYRTHTCTRFFWIQNCRWLVARIRCGRACKYWQGICCLRSRVLKDSKSVSPKQRSDCWSIHQLSGTHNEML